jgi:heme/copper-type cytochrome/quinol oxidase subunit 2
MLRRQWFLGLGLLAASLGLETAIAQPVDGAILFEQHCAACHSLGGGDRVGPDLAGVTQRRDEAWLRRMIREPDTLVAEGDPVVTALVERYNRIVMPNLGLDEATAGALIAHLRSHDAGQAAPVVSMPPVPAQGRPDLIEPQSRIWWAFLLLSAVVVLVFAFVALSTRSPRDVDTARAYALRRGFFAAAAALALGALAATLPRTPYAAHGANADDDVDRIVYVAARQFEFIWSDEPIVDPQDVGRVPRLSDLALGAGAVVEFRVTSLDVTHGFGLFGPQRQLVAQTQAMPGYVNRLRVRLDEPGAYSVFCLEYCAAGHHRMRSGLTVR